MANIDDLGKGMNRFQNSVQSAIKDVEDLSKRLSKIAEGPQNKMTENFDKSLKLIAAIAGEAKDTLKYHEKMETVGKKTVKQAIGRVKHTKILDKMVTRGKKIDFIRFKLGKVGLQIKQKFGRAADKELQAAYDTVDAEREKSKFEQKTLELKEKATDALKSQLVQFAGAASIFAVLKTIAFSFAGTIDSLGASFGVAGAGSGKLQESLLAGNIEATKLGKGMDDLVTITNTLASDFGISLQTAADISDTILDSSNSSLRAVSNESLLTADEGAKLFGTLMSIGNLSVEAAETLAESTYQLALASDVAPHEVIKDIAENTDAFAKFAGKGGKNIAQAAVQAKKLGLGLGDVAGIAEGLLDFEASLTSEMEASVLLGRRINLDKARQLAFAGDMSGMMKEALKQMGGEAAFNKMNIFQRKALAATLGLEVSQMAKLVGETGKIAKAPPTLENLVGKDALSSLTQMINKLKAFGVTLSQEIGEQLLVIVKRFNNWIINAGGLETIEKIVLGIGKGFQFLVGKFDAIVAGFVAIKLASWAASIASSAAFVAGSTALTLGVGTLAALATIAGIYATVRALQPPSHADLPAGAAATATKGAAMFHAGETVVHTSEIKEMVTEMKKMRKEMNQAFGFDGRIFKQPIAIKAA